MCLTMIRFIARWCPASLDLCAFDFAFTCPPLAFAIVGMREAGDSSIWEECIDGEWVSHIYC